MERHALNRLALTLIAVTLLASGGYAAWRARPVAGKSHVPATSDGRLRGPPTPIVPAGVRVRVEVVNATKVRGLARKATLYLRDLGFDVVDFRNGAEKRDSTLILDRSGHPAWAALASRALGGARVESQPDSSRYLDLTILLGAAWRPPAQPFYP